MKVKYGFGISSASGSMGGITASRNSAGSYLRNKSIPINPNSDRQQEIRAAMAMLADYWSGTLNQDQRDAWDLYGSSVVMKDSLGDDIYLSGYNQFIRSSVPMVQAGIDLVPDGPTVFELPEQDPALAITATESTQILAYAFDDGLPWATEADAWMLCYQGKPQNPQRNFFGGPWRYTGRIEGADPTPPVTPDEQPVSFAVAAGQGQWVRCRILRADGRLSEPFRAQTIVVAGV